MHEKTSVGRLFDLTGKTALVTGGARGIGKSIAEVLVQAGANVAILDVDLAEARRTASELTPIIDRDEYEISDNPAEPGVSMSHTRSALPASPEVIALQADVTIKDDINNAITDIVQRWGQLDITFCNAGICINVSAEEMSLEQWQKVLDINLTGVFLTAQAAGRQMIQQQTGGTIINTASMSAHVVNTPQPQCSYNASKAGVIQLTKSLAVEWAKYGIRVNSISPGYIGTDLTLNAPSLKPLIDQWEAVTPMKRLGKPSELQGIALYLASEASSFATGSDFVIDGGFTAI